MDKKDFLSLVKDLELYISSQFEGLEVTRSTKKLSLTIKNPEPLIRFSWNEGKPKLYYKINSKVSNVLKIKLSKSLSSENQRISNAIIDSLKAEKDYDEGLADLLTHVLSLILASLPFQDVKIEGGLTASDMSEVVEDLSLVDITIPAVVEPFPIRNAIELTSIARTDYLNTIICNINGAIETAAQAGQNTLKIEYSHFPSDFPKAEVSLKTENSYLKQVWEIYGEYYDLIEDAKKNVILTWPTSDTAEDHEEIKDPSTQEGVAQTLNKEI